LALEPWEPAYPVATYHPDRVELPAPPLPAPGELQVIEEAAPHEAAAPHDEGRRALLDLVAAWTAESNGRGEAVAVTGGAPDALRALGVRRYRTAPLQPAGAMATMAWCGASGGAHGRRRGMAAGRFAAWWAVAALAGLLDSWPLTGAEAGRAAQRLRWWLWDVGEPERGWVLHLAAEDPAGGRAWAVSAVDAAS
jgi:hypothetical protein